MRVETVVAVLAAFPLLALSAPPQQQSIDLTLTAQPGQRLEVDLPSVSGRIEIAGVGGDSFSIEGTVSAREWRDDNEVIVDQISDGIRIYSEYLEGRSPSNDRRLRAELTIRVPERFDIQVNSAMDTTLRDVAGSIVVWIGNNDIDASGLSGEAELSVANGSLRIRASDLDGELSNTNGSLTFTGGSFRGRLSSTNGGAELDAVSGDLEVEATNGSVRLGDVAGSLRGELTNGSVDAGVVAGDIRLQTVNGSVSATISGSEDVNIETLNGSVELAAPADLSATFDIEVRQTEPERGRDRPEIRSDFPLDVRPGQMRGGDYYRTASGASGDGSWRIEIHATNGNVTLRSR